MKIGIIGAGKVGCAFAIALADRGAEIAGVCSRTPQAAEYLSNRLDIAPAGDVIQLVKAADVVLLTVPDGAIAETAVQISRSCGCADIGGKTFLHCSGALASAVLEPLSKAGAYTGSLHPVQTFADRKNGWKGMSGIYFGFEGSEGAADCASKLVGLLNGVLLDIRPEAKPLYHAAACILSNYTVTLSYVSGMLLERAGIDRDTGVRAFMPLLRNTVENIAAAGSVNALTGPVARGDWSTVAGHIAALDEKDNTIAGLYRVLGKMTVRLALEKGSIDEAKAGALLDVLR